MLKFMFFTNNQTNLNQSYQWSEYTTIFIPTKLGLL